MSRKYLEICRILAGNITRDENGVILAAEKKRGLHMNLNYEGRYNGATAATYFGLSVRYQKFEITGNAKRTLDLCYKELSLMGAPIRVNEPKDAEAVIIWRYMLNPVVLTLQVEGKELVLTAYTARQPLGQVACFRTMNRFYKALKDLLTVKEGEKLLDRDAIKSREQRRAEKDAIKVEKKATKEAERASKKEAEMSKEKQITADVDIKTDENEGKRTHRRKETGGKRLAK